MPNWASDQWQKACIGLVTPNRIRHLSPAASPGWVGDLAYTLYILLEATFAYESYISDPL
jgi:hypothetical protein